MALTAVSAFFSQIHETGRSPINLELREFHESVRQTTRDLDTPCGVIITASCADASQDQRSAQRLEALWLRGDRQQGVRWASGFLETSIYLDVGGEANPLPSACEPLVLDYCSGHGVSIGE